MRIKKDVSIISFAKPGKALELEALLKDKRLGRIIPTPGEISAGCGFSWRVDIEMEAEVLNIIRANNIEYDKITHMKMY